MITVSKSRILSLTITSLIKLVLSSKQPNRRIHHNKKRAHSPTVEVNARPKTYFLILRLASDLDVTRILFSVYVEDIKISAIR